MKKYISYLLTLALLVPAFVSCTEQLEDLRSKNQKTHTVYFSTTDRATKTGLTIEDNLVKPDWQKTDLEIIHFFEIGANKVAAPGTADEINLSDDNRTAHFKAAISDEITIIVSPSDGDNGSKGAKSAGVSPFTFAAVVAQMPDKDAYTFVIPSEQHPDAETLKDPNAEFLVGYSRRSYAEQYDYDGVVVDLYFDRVAALGRLAISGFIGTGEKVKSVTITANGGMTGKATYPGDFTLGDKNKVNFTKVNEPLVLAYGDGVAAPAEDPFYAYFVAVPGEATVTSIEVLTDQYKYTKTVEGGASFTFSDEQLLNIDFALSEDIAEAVTADNKTWYKASMLEAGYDYLIVSGGQALKNNGNNNVVAAKEVTILENNTIELDDTEGVLWTVADADQSLADNGKFTLKNATEYLYRHGGSSTSTLEASTSPATPKYGVWDYEDGYFFNISTSQGTSIYYAYYDSGWKITTTKTAAMIFTNRPPIEISFASATAKYDLDNEEWTVAIPELTAPEGANITYSSSNEDIATVAADGTVTPKAAGNARITATVAGDDEHQGGSAYYDLTVSTSKITTWYKADELVDGEVYMIVSNANALRLDGTSLATVANSAFTGDSFQYEADDNLKWTATASSGKFTFKSGNHFLSRSSTNIQTNTSSGATWSYDSAQNYITTAGSSSTYYLYFSESQGKWQVQTSGGDTHKAAVYTMTPALVSRNLSFSAETVTHDLADGEDVNEPELTGDSIEGVTYASENEQIATVNANTGAVTLTGKTGSVKITASAPKTDTYKEESVSYTLKVTDSNAPIKTYRKVTKASDLEVGVQYLLVYEDGKKVFKPILNAGNNPYFSAEAGNALSVTITDGTIVSSDFEECEMTLEDGYHFYVASANYYLYPTNSNYNAGCIAAENSKTDSHKFSISISSSGIATINRTSNGSDYRLCYSDYFRGSSSVSANVVLYKLDAGTTPPTPEKQDRELSFGTESLSVTLGQAATFPTLSGVTDGVTYSSSNESVATVNASGVVSVKAAGTTIIKAEAQESDTYLAGSAQYELTVKSASTTTTTFYRATKLEAGKEYLVVSSNMALTNNGGTIGATEVTATNGAIELNDDVASTMLWTATTLGSGFTLSNDGQFVQRATGSGSGTPAPLIGAVPETARYYTWVYDKSNSYLNTVQESSYSAYYIYYSGGAWAQSSTASSSHTVTLYTTEPNVDPTYTFVKVTSASGLIAGKKYVLVYEDGSKVFNPILNGSSFTASTANAISVTISNGSITSSDLEDCLLTLEDGYYLYVESASMYLYPTSNIGAEATKGSSHYFNISISNGIATISRTSNNSTYNLRYSSSGGYFQSSTSSANISLYRLDDGTIIPDDPGDDPTPTTSTYTQVSFATGITTGKYLIVNPADTHVFNTSTNASNAVAVSATGGVISGDYSSYELTITKNGDNYTIQNGSNQYLYYNYSQGDQRVGYQSNVNNWTVSAGSDASDTNAFRFTSSSQNIYWNSTYFRIGGSGTAGVHLYKKAENP